MQLPLKGSALEAGILADLAKIIYYLAITEYYYYQETNDKCS